MGSTKTPRTSDSRTPETQIHPTHRTPFRTLHITRSTPMALRNNSAPTAQMMLVVASPATCFSRPRWRFCCTHRFQQVSHAATHNRREEPGNSCFGLKRRSANLVSSQVLYIVIRLDGSEGMTCSAKITHSGTT